MQDKVKMKENRDVMGLDRDADYEMAPKGSEQLKKMREIDIRTVNKSTLVEISNVEIDTSLPDKERMMDFIQKIRNPYCYLDHGTVVKISFCGESRLEECLKKCIALK